MPIKPRDMEKIILADGWRLETQTGSHKQYIHSVKRGKVTIPFHNKDLPIGTELSIYRQAQIKRR
ncbi:MAG: type II toxin-antitoxin system HicA family toxin [Candidatus Ornithomonoglobus sp.]